MHTGHSTVLTVTKVKGAKIETRVQTGSKGELLHNDQDAVEYSAEEDNADDELVSALKVIARKTKGKDLPKVDHNKVEYEPFRKDFYVEVPELAKMTKAQVLAQRVELENIKVKGKQCPHPIRTWAQCGLPTKVLDVMKKCGYTKPTPIQAQAIPAVMAGRDMIGIARTGSGKTLGFVLPMLRHVLDQRPIENDDGPIAVILTPTRELAIQIYNECRKFCKLLKLWCICVYGGTGISEQIADLKRGAEIVVCTPGRMIDMLAANGGRVTNLRRTTYLVLDEADRMFDMGFEPQVMKIISNTRPDRQTVLFSATFPRQMEALARKILTKPIEVQVGGRSIVCKDVHQSVLMIEDHQKFFKLLELLGIYSVQGCVLVFVERQEAADALARDLTKSSYLCMALHGGMDQFDRDSTISDFKNGSVKILVATSVAARGLDVKHLILVVNYDCPNHYEDYVHRCGRTGRAGNKGFAYTFITPEQQRLVGDIIKALELSGGHISEEVEDLWKKYLEKLKAEGKIKTLPGGKMMPLMRRKKAIGFTGKGFKFDEKEAVKTVESKLKQKSALGMADDDDDDQFALLTLDKKLDDIFNHQVKVVDPNAPVLPPALQALVLAKPGILPTPPLSQVLGLNLGLGPGIGGGGLVHQAVTPSMSTAAATAAAAASGMGRAAQEAASCIMKGADVKVSGAVLASQIAASINAKVGAAPAKVTDTILPLGTVIAGQEQSADQPFLKYMDEIEINSFPQQIRFRITTREVLDDIGEFSESYVSVRGLYVPESRAPKIGEKRLFLSLEAKNERAIQRAKQEIKRVIKEEAQRMASRIRPQQQTGRYSVL